MRAPKEQVTVEINLSPDVFVAMRMIGLEGENLAREMKRTMAIDLFKKGLLSIGKAAELAETCLADFMDLLVKEGVTVVEYTREDLRQDMEALERLGQ